MIYVDPLCNHGWVIYGKTVKSCHMWTDGDLEELHQIAEKIGLSKKYFQKGRFLKHYDLTERRRSEAIKNGAVELDRKQSVEQWKKLKSLS